MYVCKSAYCIAAAAASALGSRYTQVNDFRSQEQKKKKQLFALIFHRTVNTSKYATNGHT